MHFGFTTVTTAGRDRCVMGSVVVVVPVHFGFTTVTTARNQRLGERGV